MMRGGEVKRRKRRCKKGGEDRISLLPDDILISILSRLTSKQATSTAILSTRWRSLYAFATRIDLPQPAPTKKRLPPIPTTTSTVDHVLNSHRGGRVKEFKVDVSCKSEEGASIGKWFDFALAKGAEVIDVSLSLSKNYPRLEHTVFNHNGGCLRELSLSRIDVDDRDLVLLLRSFPLLERLTVSTSSLRNPSIVGHSTCKLKHLVISGNQFLESIEIDGLTSLVSLGCYALSSRHSLSLRNVPKLVDFSTHDQSHYTIPSTFSKFPSIGDQIQSLKLYWHYSWADYDKLHMQFLGMRNLDITFPLSSLHFEYLDGLLQLIQACPSLEKLEIKVKYWSRSGSESRKERVARANEENNIICIDWRSLPELKLSPDLKKVKLSGFVGTSSELEFALSIMKNVVALEELVVEACGDKKRRALATRRARQHFVPTMLPYPFTLLVI